MPAAYFPTDSERGIFATFQEKKIHSTKSNFPDHLHFSLYVKRNRHSVNVKKNPSVIARIHRIKRTVR